MNPFNEANRILHQILIVEDMVMEIGLHDFFLEGWNYISPYPLLILPEQPPTTYRFLIRLFRYSSESNSLKLIDLEYHSASGANIVYVPNPEIRDSENQIGKNLIKKESFLNMAKPLLLQGFREIAFKSLMDSK